MINADKTPFSYACQRSIETVSADWNICNCWFFVFCLVSFWKSNGAFWIENRKEHYVNKMVKNVWWKYPSQTALGIAIQCALCMLRVRSRSLHLIKIKWVVLLCPFEKGTQSGRRVIDGLSEGENRSILWKFISLLCVCLNGEHPFVAIAQSDGLNRCCRYGSCKCMVLSCLVHCGCTSAVCWMFVCEIFFPTAYFFF